MLTTDGQVRKLMEEMSKHVRVGLAAMRAGIDRKTARKYVKTGKLPSELAASPTWRTRPDPFAAEWPALAARLDAEPGLEAKTLFELLCEEHPARYEPGQLRTLFPTDDQFIRLIAPRACHTRRRSGDTRDAEIVPRARRRLSAVGAIGYS